MSNNASVYNLEDDVDHAWGKLKDEVLEVDEDDDWSVDRDDESNVDVDYDEDRDDGLDELEVDEYGHREASPANAPEAPPANASEVPPVDAPNAMHASVSIAPRTSVTASLGNSIVMSGQSSGFNDIQVGDVFMCKKDLTLRLSVLAMRRNFEFKVKKSKKDIYVVVCRTNECKWRLRAMRLKGCDVLKVSKYCNIHTCQHLMLSHNHRQATSSVLGQYLKPKFQDVDTTYRPKDIIRDIRQDLGVNLSYDRAWRAREEALKLVRGSPEESYKLLPPKQVSRVGRRQTVRIPPVGEVCQVHKCGRCGGLGHNRKTCRQPLNTV